MVVGGFWWLLVIPCLSVSEGEIRYQPISGPSQLLEGKDRLGLASFEL